MNYNIRHILMEYAMSTIKSIDTPLELDYCDIGSIFIVGNRVLLQMDVLNSDKFAQLTFEVSYIVENDHLKCEVVSVRYFTTSKTWGDAYVIDDELLFDCEGK